jgi:hypothetical protein
MIEVNSTDFQFATDEESLAYLQKIVESMLQLFEVKPKHCIECINRAWSHMPMVGDDLVYRESPYYWANHFMFGKDSYWWVYNREGLEPLKPLPYWSDKIKDVKNQSQSM